MENIIMKDLLDYPHIYAITKDGQIWSYKSNRFLKNRITSSGAVKINLWIDGKYISYSVARLTYCTWNNLSYQESKKYELIFKDNNNTNINLENLLLTPRDILLENEEIKLIPNYEDYGVTKNGKIWSYKSKRYLKPGKDKDGYLRVILCKDGKRKGFSVHRLVLMTWEPIDNYYNMQVNHKDENKENNSLENLEWVTLKENIQYGTGIKRSHEQQKLKIRCIETGLIFESQLAVTSFLKLKSASNISSCLAGRLETCGGYHWERVKEGENNG